MEREDQLTRVRKMADQRKTENGKVITVVSGKGGVGKTNLALNLSIALSRMNNKVSLFDADLHFSNVNLFTEGSEKGILPDVLAGSKSKTLGVTEESGVTIFSSPSGISNVDMFDEYVKDDFFREIYNHKMSDNFIVVDTGAGFSQTIVDFAQIADHLIVLITPEPASVSDGYAMVKVLNSIEPDREFKIVVNLVKSGKEAEEVFERFSLVVEHFLGAKISYLGFISNDKNVREAVMLQKPVINFKPESAASRCIKQIAGRFTE